MKSVLYVGATLMIGASIYGFVDYKQTSHKKEFTNMYVEEKVKEPAPEVVTENNEVAVVSEPAKNSKTISAKKKAVKKDETGNYPAEEVITPIKPIAEEDLMNADDSKKIEEANVTVTPSTEHSVFKKVKRKRLNTKIFSRAPLRDEVEVVEVKVMPKADVKKEKQ